MIRILLSLTLACSALLCADTSISLPEFVRLMSSLSETEGYFDTDNLVSNERAYLKILPELRRQNVSGGAYVGVGPDQNYSYIASLKPRIAVIVDIRRKNALQHLYFKALFKLSSNRSQYLERLFGRRVQPPVGDPKGEGISRLLRAIDASSPDKSFANEKLAEAIREVSSWGCELSAGDLESIRDIAGAFIANGPDLKFSSYYRPPRSYYPSYRQLLEETDADGEQANFLASEESFLLIRKMQSENRIIPVVGDLAGDHALLQTGEELRRRGIKVTCLYVSNVEYYLFGGQSWSAYVRNIGKLPLDSNAFLIRSYAQYRRPAATPGYYMGTIVQPVGQFLADETVGKNTSYWSLIPTQSPVQR